MLKKSFLTPVLAGVLAVTVVGSGVGYYFEFVKNSDDASVKDETTDGGTKATLTVDEAAKSIEEHLDKAKQAANGELDTGYKAAVTYTAPSDANVKDVSVGMEAKQKDKVSGVDYTIGYDSQTLLTLNLVYDNENETAYVKIPELSDAVLTGTTEEIEEWLSGSFTGNLDDSDYYYDSDTYEASAFTQVMTVTEGSDYPDLDALAEIDYSAVIDDLSTYVDTIKENAPDPTDGEDYTVQSGSVSLDLTSKVYTVTSSDADKILAAVAEKGKADETLKNAALSLGATEDDYTSMWDEIADGVDADDTTVDFIFYYLGDDFAGWKVINSEGQEELHMITASDDTNTVIDWRIIQTDSSSDDEFTANGAITLDGDVLNGTVTYNYSDGETTATADVSYNSLTVTEDSLIGDMVCTAQSDDYKAVMTYTFNNNGESIDTKVSLSMNDEDSGSVSVTSQQTDASDISIPTGTAYKITDDAQLEEYLSGCDIDGWQETLKSALGDEIYNEIFGSYSDITSDTDYDYDYSDYDYFSYDDDISI